MNRRAMHTASRGLGLALFVLICGATECLAQSPRVVYTWGEAGELHGWQLRAGQGAVESVVDGELSITETGLGAGWEISDDFNTVFEGAPGEGGLDVTGLAAIEFDLGHSGEEAVDAQFFVEATPASTRFLLGDVQSIAPGLATYSAPLAEVPAEAQAYLRTIGVTVLDHFDVEEVVWTIAEVRTAGEPLSERVIASHEPGSPDGGLNGAYVNFENAAVQGNDGGQNQTGLSVSTDEPPGGNTGSLRWTDLAGNGGAAVTWVNGTTLFEGNTFWERPADLSNYTSIVVRMAATNVDGLLESVDVQYFLQTGNYNFFQAGAITALPADGEFHELEFAISSVPQLDFVVAHGVNIGAHDGGHLVIDVDSVTAIREESFPDCNENGIPDTRDIVDGTSGDCNFNGIPDECDIKFGTSDDCDDNAVPDDCELQSGDATRLLYTWAGTGDTRGWDKAFGDNDISLENSIGGELTVFEEGAPGSSVALRDDFNGIFEGAVSIGGVDLTGMTQLEFDMGHDGVGTINVQFYVQATPEFEYLALGPDQAIEPGVTTYVAPLDSLNAAQLTYIRVVGVNIRAHELEGNLVWTLQEVRALGSRLTQRDIATHEPGSSDNGLQGATVNFDNGAVKGNDGGQNQTGLEHNTSAQPPGNTGSLQWADVAGGGGAAISWFNGTAFGGDSFNERPVDLRDFDRVLVRMAATEQAGRDVPDVVVGYYFQTAGFSFQGAGFATLPADGEFHELEFPLDGVTDLDQVDAHGIDVQDHPNGDLVINVDRVRFVAAGDEGLDCNGNGILDACDIASGGSSDTNGDGVPDECGPIDGTPFRRGDTNDDGAVNISDPQFGLNFLFLGGPGPLCLDAADSNDDGAFDVSDNVYTLNRLFKGGPAIPAPGADECGEDPTDDPLACEYESCP